MNVTVVFGPTVSGIAEGGASAAGRPDLVVTRTTRIAERAGEVALGGSPEKFETDPLQAETETSWI